MYTYTCTCTHIMRRQKSARKYVVSHQNKSSMPEKQFSLNICFQHFSRHPERAADCANVLEKRCSAR